LSRLFVIKLLYMLAKLLLKGFPKRHFYEKWVVITFPDISSPCWPCSNRRRVFKAMEFQKDRPILSKVDKIQYSSQIPLKFSASFEAPSNYAGGIWKAALFLRLGLQCTLMRHENGGFQKRSSNRKGLKTLAFCVRVESKHFENGAFCKTMTLR